MIRLTTRCRWVAITREEWTNAQAIGLEQLYNNYTTTIQQLYNNLYNNYTTTAISFVFRHAL
jgi:hypothetical protein